MLPIENLIRTNFVDGIRFNPQQIQLTNKYYDSKIGLANAYGIGKGILVGFKNSLSVVIENNKLFLKPGALIDGEGNILYVNKEHLILDNLANKQFENKKSLYIYIQYKTKLEDIQESRHDKDIKLHYKISDDYQIFIQEKNFRDKTLMELARFYVDSSSGSNLKMAINPFNPSSNEIDIRFAPKVVSQNNIMSPDEKILISSILRKYANFLNELSFRKRVISASGAASYAYKVSSDVMTGEVTPWQLYDMLYELLNISLYIYKERAQIVNTALWKNIKRLQSIFQFTESYEVDYYETHLDIDSSFFSKVIMHYSNAAVFDGNWDNILEEEEEKETANDKGYLIVGSAKSCDVHVEGEDIAQEHAKLFHYKGGFFIEDIGNTSGVYVNAEKVDKGVKKFVRAQDYIVLGKNGKILNLHNI
ncbi:MAG: FHA domain-containing protein [Campylobacterota bacterium]|nr:FHA domain-containing protein [Campylobacterota bacterium]